MIDRRMAAIVLGALACAACSAPDPKLTADEYYTEGKGAYTTKNYEVAIHKYKDLLDQYPFDSHAEEAELAIAESQYKKHHYAEAITAFNDFQRMHPMSPDLPKVYYLMGKSYQRQMTSIDRDQGAADNAQGWFRVVLDRYPQSEFAPPARRNMAECRESIAAHEGYISLFYIKLKNMRAAENRVKGILENYPDTVATTHALEDLAAAYEKSGDAAQAEVVRNVINERLAAFATLPESGPGSRRQGAVPAIPTPVSDAFLADLTGRYGQSERVANVTAPTLVDQAPQQPHMPQTGGGPGYGPSGPMSQHGY